MGVCTADSDIFCVVVFSQDNDELWLAESTNCGVNQIDVDSELDLATIPGECPAAAEPTRT